MYYGYIKYKDLFVIESNNISKTIFKYILFIDSGHSKTNFVLSKFRYNKFSVEYVEFMSELGGRNFDELLVKYCFEEFKKSNDLDIEMTDIIKYKLSEEIQKSRIKLTVNSETLITIDALYEDYDLVIEITKNKFEEIIKDYLQEFSNTLQKVIQYSKENNFIIDYVEIAGELMRTPIIQQILIDNKLTISKTILIDECTSVGSSLLDYFFRNKENFPIVKLNRFIEFTNDKKDKSQKINFNSLSNKIKEHISKFNELDDIYYKFINFKNDNLKILYFLKDYFRNNDDIKKQINEIEKNIKGNNGNLNSLENDEKNIKKIAFLLIDELIQNSEIKEKTKSILQNMKNEKKFNFKEFKKIYEQLNLKSF
jgi:hypothetical protein